MATQEANGQLRKSIKVPIPTDRYPQYNFVGRLLGPRGSTLKQMQRDTQTWIRIRGRGSMRDKQEEARIRNQPGHEHLLEPLHVHIEARGDPNMIDHLLSNAEQVVKALLVPVEESKDVHKKEQLRQLAQVRAQEQMGGGAAYMDPTGQTAAAAAAADPYGMYAAYYNNPYSGYYAAYYQQAAAAAGGANPYQQQQYQQQAWGTPTAAAAQQTSETPTTTTTTTTTPTTATTAAASTMSPSSSSTPATDNVTAAVDAAAVEAPAASSTSGSDNVEDCKRRLAEVEAERKLLEGLLDAKDGEGGLAKRAPHTNRLLSAYEQRLRSSAGQDDVKMMTETTAPAQTTGETATANPTAAAAQESIQGHTGGAAATFTSASTSSSSVAAAAILTPTTTTNTTPVPAPPGTVAPPPPGTVAAAAATGGFTNGMVGGDTAFMHPSRAAMVTEGSNGSDNSEAAHKSGGPIRTERGTNRYTPY